MRRVQPGSSGPRSRRSGSDEGARDVPDLISRFSSRNQRLSHVFLKDRLQGAETYDRIAGYFRSSVFDLIHEEISTIGRVRIVCNADLDPRDLTAAMRGNYGMIALDEGHKARVKRGIGMDEPEPGKLYRAMERLARR